MIKNTTTPRLQNNYWGVILLLIIFIYITCMSYLMPLIQDDFILNGKGSFFPSWYEYWHHHAYGVKNSLRHLGGRIGYFIIPFVNYSFYRAPLEEELSNITYAIINGGIFLSFLWGLFILIHARSPKLFNQLDLIRIILLFFLALTLLATPFETIFWFHGRINYLWVITLLLWFLVFYRLNWADKNFLSFMKKPSISFSQTLKKLFFWWGFLLLATIAGMASEAGGMVVIILLASIFIYKKFIAREKLSKWIKFGFLFFILGYAVMMLAPGNYHRMEHLQAIGKNLLALPFFEQYFIHPLKGALIFLIETKFMPIIALLSLGYWYKTISVKSKNFIDGLIKKIKTDQFFGYALLLFMLTLLFVAGMGLNPAHYARAWFFGTVMFLLCLMTIIDHFFLSPKRLFFLKKTYLGKTISQYIFLLFSGCFISYLVWLFVFMVIFHQSANQRIQSLLEQKAMGKTTIVLEKIPNKYFIYDNGHSYNGVKSLIAPENTNEMQSQFWRFFIARYYGVKEIIYND
ncbi:MAG: DUF6056 family protein [Alphaproteobacteria bacterium]